MTSFYLDVLAKILNLHTKGPILYDGSWYQTLDVDKNEVINEMFVDETNLDSSNLKSDFKILHNMSQHCLLPRSRTKNKIYDCDLFLMYHIFYGLETNLPYMILHYMMCAALVVNKKTTIP